MIKIPLTQGKVAIIDDEDYPLISQYKWRVFKHRNTYYACTTLRRKTILMHRVILNAQKGQEVDHCNHNELDNRRFNLRFATDSQQIQNSRKKQNCSSQFKGVSWHKINKKWRAQIGIDKKHIHLGCFGIEEQAAKIYNEAALKYFGEFACLNQIS